MTKGKIDMNYIYSFSYNLTNVITNLKSNDEFYHSNYRMNNSMVSRKSLTC
nr:MAG TPA: hypothetical protein [Bacteriophage sp.]